VDEAAKKAFKSSLDKYHGDMHLRVDPGARSVRILHRYRDSSFNVTEQMVTEQMPASPEDVASDFLKQIDLMARYVFVGKGAPEHCQLVLELVDHWKLAPSGPSGLQSYADKALGLDCNGFVGNYLWHVNGRHDWSSLGIRNQDEGPDFTIDAYFHRRKSIHRWKDLNPARSYIMGLVDEKTGLIIPGGPKSPPGHIAITEPGRFRPRTASQPPAVWAVESTVAHKPGLWESWYSVISEDGSGIFTMKREAMVAHHQIKKFRIAPV
jgi:hypothetical protein